MKKVLKISVMLWGISGFLMVLIGAAHAQNFAGTMAPEPAVGAMDSMTNIDEPFVDESYLVKSEDAQEAVEETSQGGGDLSDSEIPDFIRNQSYYSLGTTDVLEVTVMRHSEVSGQYVINNEGKIQYDFVGDVYVEGLTKNEVKALIIKRLSKFIISPEVTVKIVGYNSKIVYVIGEVGRPGKIFMRGDTITVREALVQAGLPLLSAKAAKSSVITPSASGSPETKNVNVHKLLYKGDLRENLVMKPGDTLYIPPTLLAKTMRIMQPIAAPIGTAAGTGRTLTTGF